MTIKMLDPAVVKNKVITIRVDFNVPVKNGRVTENTRILESIPTLNYLLKHGAKQIHILSHLGRPKGEVDPKYTLKVVLPELEKALGEPVEFRPKLTVGKARVQLHENVRFYPGEKKNDPQFIQKMLGLGADIFINDGFAVSHRPHASVIGLGSFLPTYPGFLLQKEIDHLSPFLSAKKMPGLTVIVGGAKIETKVKVLEHFAKTADNILIGGALANTFLAAQGINVGASFYQSAQAAVAKRIIDLAEKHSTGLYLPTDVVCAQDMKDAQAENKPLEAVLDTDKIFDIGSATISHYQKILQSSKIIIWNGPLGCFEYKPFEAGTREVLKTIAAQKSCQTILGGGDTLEAIRKFGVSKKAFTHVSTGGGAMLEFLEGKELPGIEILKTSK